MFLSALALSVFTVCPPPAPFPAAKQRLIARIAKREVPTLDLLPAPFEFDREVLVAWLRAHSDDESPWSRFVALGRLADDACSQELAAPFLEQLATTCRSNSDQCEQVSALVFRRQISRLIEATEQPVAEVLDCEGAQSLEACVQARVPDAMVVHGTFWLAVAPVKAGVVHVLSGTLEKARLRIAADEVMKSEAADVLRRRKLISPFGVETGDTPTNFGFVRKAEKEWRSGIELEPGTAQVACTDGSLKPLHGVPRRRAVWQTFPPLWTLTYAYELPCEARLVVPSGTATGWREFPIKRLRVPTNDPPDQPEFELDGPFVGGERVRKFGAATYREHEKQPGQRTSRVCTVEGTLAGAAISTRIESGYGCQLQFAADFNGDGLSDFVVHLGSESCEFDVLFESGPGGWTEVARTGSCE